MRGHETQPFAKRFEAQRDLLDRTYANAKQLITPALFNEVATEIANVYRPSGTVMYTLGPVLEQMLSEFQADPQYVRFIPNDRKYRKSWNNSW